MWFFKKAPYSIENMIYSSNGVVNIQIYNAIRNEDKRQCSVIKIQKLRSEEYVTNFVKNIKTIRHPLIPHFIEEFDQGGVKHIAIERILVLDLERLSEYEIIWGIYNLTYFISFLFESSNAIHGQILQESLFITPGNEFKICGLEFLTIGDKGPMFDKYHDWESIHSSTYPSSLNRKYIDLYFLSMLIDKWKSKLPQTIVKFGRRWSRPDETMPPPSNMLSLKMWKDDSYFSILVDLKEFELRSSIERDNMFRSLLDSLDKFSESMKAYSILPTLLKNIKIFPSPLSVEVVLTISKNLSDLQLKQQVTDAMIQLIQTRDKALIFKILQYIEVILPTIGNSVNDSLFSTLLQFLNDQALAQISIVAMVPIAKYLNSYNFKSLMRALKSLQTASDPNIRTNSVLCIAKIIKYDEPEQRASRLMQSLNLALQDKNLTCKKAAMTAYKTCVSMLTSSNIAEHAIPALSPLCADPSDDIRLPAMRLMKLFFEKVIESDIDRLEEPEQTTNVIEAADQKVDKPVVHQSKSIFDNHDELDDEKLLESSTTGKIGSIGVRNNSGGVQGLTRVSSIGNTAAELPNQGRAPIERNVNQKSKNIETGSTKDVIDSPSDAWQWDSSDSSNAADKDKEPSIIHDEKDHGMIPADSSKVVKDVPAENSEQKSDLEDGFVVWDDWE